MNNDNIVKKVCKELGITYKELGERIGYSESNLRKSVSENKVSTQLQKSIEMYLEINHLKQKLKKCDNFIALWKELSKEVT